MDPGYVDAVTKGEYKEDDVSGLSNMPEELPNEEACAEEHSAFELTNNLAYFEKKFSNYRV